MPPVSCCPVEITQNIQVDGIAPIPVAFYNQDAGYDWELKNDKAGDYVAHQLAFTVPKGRIAVDKFILTGMNQKWAVRFKQTDGTIRLLQNMRLAVSYSTDKNQSGKNAYSFKLVGTTEYPAGHFSGNITGMGAWITDNSENWITDDDETWTYVF